jgi:hypothetical protein
MSGWIGVDLDGTLAEYTSWKGSEHIGKPILPMLARVKKWLEEGKTVKIFTARASIPSQILPVRLWCIEHIGVELPVTNQKDFSMIELWDDRCVSIETNTGKIKNEPYLSLH